MNKINIILFSIILLVFILYNWKQNYCKSNSNSNSNSNDIKEPFAQVATLNVQAGLNNDGNNGASGGGGAGGITGGSTNIQSNGGLPLTSTSGFAGGDGINNNTTADYCYFVLTRK